jgi:ERCC4-related helicase
VPRGGTLEGLADKLEAVEHAEAAVEEIPAEISESFESLDEISDEWTEENGHEQEAKQKKLLTSGERKLMQQELSDLRFFAELAKSILRNSKGDKLLTALRNGLRKTTELGANEKAIIFTESTRTQEYLRSILEVSAYKRKVVLFNGSNNDSRSKEIGLLP